jgi:hypothetical protein
VSILALGLVFALALAVGSEDGAVRGGSTFAQATKISADRVPKAAVFMASRLSESGRGVKRGEEG